MFKNKVCITVLLLCFSIPVGAATLEMHIQMANDALAKKDINQALGHYLAASELIAHSNGQMLLNIAELYLYQKKIKEAIGFYGYLLALEPNNLEAMRGYAKCLIKDHRLFDAIATLEKGMAIDANNESVRLDLLKLYLKSGQFQKAQSIRPIKHWWYDENITGKSILLDIDRSGNGFGDTFQYIRYAKILKDRGAHVTVKARPRLNSILSLCPYIDCIINQSPDLSIFHNNYNMCIATLMILTHQEINYQAPQAYLYASKDLQELWHKKINSNEFNIGLCWEASPNRDRLTEQVILNSRSVHAKEFSTLKDVSGAHFYSLQRLIQHKPDINITYVGNDFDASHGAFMDTAALIKNLDLVITVDTSIAHLAGALGVPVWVMLISDCDFRWLENSAHTRWYPTMRLFRQKKFGDWTTVVAEIKRELINLL